MSAAVSGRSVLAMFTTIVVGYDDSGGAQDAVALALALADDDTRLVVVCAYPIGGLTARVVPPEHGAIGRDDAYARLDSARSLVAGRAKVDFVAHGASSGAAALHARASANDADLIVVGGLVEHVGGGPGLQRLARERRIVLHRQHHDRRVGRLLAQLRDGRQRGLVAEVEVEHQHLGADRAHLAQRVLHGRGLGDDLEVVLGLQHEAQPAAHDRVVVGQHDPRRSSIGHGPAPYRPPPGP
jgi:nucleotide-binding universal stress UspA family protein